MCHRSAEKFLVLKYNLQGRVRRAQGEGTTVHMIHFARGSSREKTIFKRFLGFFEIPENSESVGQAKTDRIRGLEHSVG